MTNENNNARAENVNGSTIGAGDASDVTGDGSAGRDISGKVFQAQGDIIINPLSINLILAAIAGAGIAGIVGIITVSTTNRPTEPDPYENEIVESPGEMLGSISGVAFFDTDQDGIRDAGEQGLAGWTIFLDRNNNGVLDNYESSVVTGANGSYFFGDLLAGTYKVRETQQPGFEQTTVNPTKVVMPGGHYVGLNFGNVSFSSSVRVNFDVRRADLLTGTPGIADIFSFSDDSSAAIAGFEDGLDVLQVSGYLTFSDLNITAGTGSSIGNTMIAIES